MLTYGTLLLETRRRLKRAGIPDASLEAREILCFASGKNGEQLLRDLSLYTSEQFQRVTERLLRRREAGEPLAYLIGEWDFYGLTLSLTPEVLIPRPDSEVLVERSLARLPSEEEVRVLDLCAGSGCIGLALAHTAPACRVVLGEWQEAALRVCRENIRRCGLNARVICQRLDALAPPPEEFRGQFHLIACNPPYIPRGDIPGLDPSVRDYEPHIALDGGQDGLDFYRSITRQWTPSLLPGGALLFEVGAGQAQAVARLMEETGFRDITVTPDTHGIPRVVEGKLPGTAE